MIHGIGAETGSQVLIIAAIGGAASQDVGVGLMLAFVAGLLVSNTIIAVRAATESSTTKVHLLETRPLRRSCGMPRNWEACRSIRSMTWSSCATFRSRASRSYSG
jgi:hypothetical protein